MSLLVYCTSVHTGVRSIIVRVYETTSTWTQSLPVVRQQYTSKFYMSICEYWKYHSPYTVVISRDMYVSLFPMSRTLHSTVLM